jgi:transposase
MRVVDAVTDLTQAQTIIARQQAELDRLTRENTLLRERIDAFCRQRFGQPSERVTDEQLRLAFAELGQPAPIPGEPTETDSGERPGPVRARRRPPGRRPLPASLPRERVEIDVADAEKTCACGTAKTRIGETTTEKLEYIPARLKVVVLARAKYACPRCHDGVAEAPAPPQAIEKSLAAEGLLAQVVVAKYVDHLPLYRQAQIFAREGLDLSRTTLCGWTADVADALAPIGDQIRREIVAADYLQTDDTSITILTEPAGRLTGRIWTYLDPLARHVVYEATPTHEGHEPATFLATFMGTLQADAYTGYDALYRTGRITELGCWAHARRYFVEALATDARAAPMLVQIRQLYHVEDEAAALAPSERGLRRREQSAPILAAIDRERRALAEVVLPKSPLGDALRYLGNQWDALQRFVEDGRVALDNNRAENQLRVIALGRKNWLFAGSLAGAKRAALLYSLVQSCRLAEISPFEYLKDVLVRIATHPQAQVAQLTPRGWAATFRRRVAA